MMRIASYVCEDGTLRYGYLRDEEVVIDLGDGDVLQLLQGEKTLEQLVELAEVNGSRRDIDSVSLRAPIPTPPKILAAAANYDDHVREGGGSLPPKTRMSPRLFIKPATCVASTGEDIVLAGAARLVDWEGELVVVIGRGGRDISIEDADEHIFGYCVGNDVSARSTDYGYERDEEPTGAASFFDWLSGKWFDGFAPFGPYLVTRDEVADPQNLDLTVSLNGRVMQDGNTKDMVFSVPELVAFASKIVTLEPGDVLFTGTPAGVGAATGTFLQAGDVVEVSIESLGTIVNRFRSPSVVT